MFQANVGNVAIADGVCFIGGDADGHFLNVIGRKRSLLEENDHSVQWRLDRRANGPFLDVGAGDFVSLSQLIHEERRIGFDRSVFPRGQSFVKIVRAGKDIFHAAPARADY